MFRKLLYLICATTFACCKSGAQRNDNNEITIAFYNCENFFDTFHNPAKEDDEFTPGGKFHYTRRVYEQKLHNIATVLQAMDGTDGPAIIGLAEVENTTVLHDLVNQPEIARRNYKYEWYDGPDPRGINVALLYHPKYFRVLRSEPVHVDLSAIKDDALTIDMLHVYGILYGDTVHILVNHWPSRRSGTDNTEPKRLAAAKVDKDLINSILARDTHAEIIVMGDFNDNPDNNTITGVLAAKGNKQNFSAADMYDPWYDIYKGGGGTEVFRHSWNLFDQILVSGSFLQPSKNRLRFENAAIFKPDFIVDHYHGHEGEPHRSFVGTHWINGFSDHFPVQVYLSK